MGQLTPLNPLLAWVAIWDGPRRYGPWPMLWWPLTYWLLGFLCSVLRTTLASILNPSGV